MITNIFKNLRNFHNYQITMAKKHNKEIDKIYKFYLGRIFFDNKKIISRGLNFDGTKISALSQKTNKNKIEINILILNSIIQNDFVSAFCLIFNNKKLTSKNLKEVLSKKGASHNSFFRDFLQKAITGNSISFNYQLFDKILIPHYSSILFSIIYKIGKFNELKNILKHHTGSSNGVLSHIYFFLQEKEIKKYFDYPSNQNLIVFPVIKDIRTSLSLESLPLLIDCHRFNLESLTLKTVFLKKFLDESLFSKLYAKKKITENFIYSIDKNFRKNLLHLVNFFDFIILLQSYETADFHSQLIIFKTLKISKEFFKKKKSPHPIVKSIFKKIKLTFFF